jgi:hypothetical protein
MAGPDGNAGRPDDAPRASPTKLAPDAAPRPERPRTSAVRAWRGPGPNRPHVPLPPDRMSALRGGRPLKSWTYVGAFGPEVMLCAAHVRIGPVRVSWWAVWDGARLIEGRRGVHATPERVRVPGRLDLALGDGTPIEVVSPHGSQYAWTRKRGGVTARGTVAGRPVELGAIVDESAGYHARRTAWRWSAGVGVAASGEPVAWNLVEGMHDAPEASECTVWIAGQPHAVEPQPFADDLSAVGGLRFAAQATRARRENLLVIASDYEQPFGTFTGELPIAGPLREGWGVMERHEARW